MKQISYSGATFVTTNGVAAALLDLTAKLGTTTSTMNVSVPSFHEGSDESVSVGMVVGPTSEIAAVPIAWQGDDPDTLAAVASLNELEHSLVIAKPVPADPDDLPIQTALEDPV